MINKQFIRKILIGGVVVSANAKAHSTKCDQVCRASELPIYMNEDDCRERPEVDLCPPKSGALESSFGAIRKQIWSVYDRISDYQKEIEECMKKTQNKASSMYKYLSEDCDDTTRMGAVGAGALTGFVLGIRGGIIRKLFYSGVGFYGMSAVCYPEKTAEITQDAIAESRKFATIAYNFIYGVKKDDIPLPNLPKLPSSMSEMWEIAEGLGKSASSLITGPPEEKVKEKEKEIISDKVDTNVPDPNEIIQESHAAASESCHCPVGACLGRHEEPKSN